MSIENGKRREYHKPTPDTILRRGIAAGLLAVTALTACSANAEPSEHPSPVPTATSSSPEATPLPEATVREIVHLTEGQVERARNMAEESLGEDMTTFEAGFEGEQYTGSGGNIIMFSAKHAETVEGHNIEDTRKVQAWYTLNGFKISVETFQRPEEKGLPSDHPVRVHTAESPSTYTMFEFTSDEKPAQITGVDDTMALLSSPRSTLY